MGLMLIASNCYWAYLHYILTNKLMSRNFYEYQQAQALLSPEVTYTHPVEHIDPVDERQARDMNSLVGIY